MPVETRHYNYTQTRVDEWKMMRDCVDGESTIKAAGTKYLPKPSGFSAQSDGGNSMYGAYIMRAQFIDILSLTIAAMIGIIHSKKIDIAIPSELEYLLDRCTSSGLSIEAFHRQITLELLTTGRYGILTTAPKDGGNPYFAGYVTESIINWEGNGSFFVLDDSGKVRVGFEWNDFKQYQELRIDSGRVVNVIHYENGSTEEIDLRSTGGKQIDRIPFTIANAIEVSSKIITPPLIGVARSCISYYQLSADWRHQLFMSGQETLVAINGEAPEYVGAGVAHSMSSGDGSTPDLKYVSPTCVGIEAHERALSNSKDQAIMAGARVIMPEDIATESGKARQLRFASETATLSTVAKSSCELLENSLRNAAMFLGFSEEAQKNIKVTPPRDLIDLVLSASDVSALVDAFNKGGFSFKTLYEVLTRGGITNPDRAVEDELKDMLSDSTNLQDALSGTLRGNPANASGNDSGKQGGNAA